MRRPPGPPGVRFLRRAGLPPGLVPVLALALVLGLGAGARDAVAAPDGGEQAFALWRRGDLPGALAASTRAVGDPAAPSSAWKVHGFLLSKAGRKAEAADAYQRAAALAPMDPVSQNNRGAILLELGRPLDALEALDRAVALAPGYADALNNRGVALERLGRLDEAVAAYRLAAGDGHAHPAAMNNLGAIAWRRGRRLRAQGSFRRAAQLDPTMVAPALNLALAVGPEAPPDAAALARLAEVARSADQDPTLKARALAVLASREAEAGRLAEARSLYLEAVGLAPEDPALLNNLAVVEDRLGMDRDAVLHLEAALAEDPTLLVARNNIGIVHAHRGSMDLAEDVFRDVLARDANFWRAHYNLGVVLGAQGRATESRTSLQRAAALQPRDGAVRYNLTIVEARLGGDVAVERRGYEAALALDPTLSEAHLALGALLADPDTPPALRDEPRARVHLGRFLELARAADADGRAQARGWLAWLDSR